MKVPEIRFTSEKDREEYLIFPVKELGLMFEKPILCYSKKQAKDIVDFYLEQGEVRITYEDFAADKDLTKVFTDISKLYVWKRVARVRKRSRNIGGDILDGEFFK